MEIIIRRKINIEAAYDDVFSQVADFKHWKNWSPWYVLEPEVHQEITGDAKKTGHKLYWKGPITGEGTNTLTEKFDTELGYDLSFVKPFKSKAATKFYFEAKNKSDKKTTDVVWELKTSLPFYLFFMKKMFEKMVEKDYDRGLLMLKDFCETGKVPAETKNMGISSLSCIDYIGIETKTTIDGIGEAMKKDFEKLSSFAEKEGKNPRDWFSIYKKFDLVKNEAIYIACISAEEFDTKIDVKKLNPSFIRGRVPGSRAYKIEHMGDYKHLGNAWSMGMMSLKAKKLKGRKYPIEKYLNAIKDTGVQDLKTEIIFPIK